MALFASFGGTPIAASTWLGATLPDEQAEPDETATPSRSSAITSVSAAIPSTPTQSVCGSRGAPAPKTVAAGRSPAIAAASASRQPAQPSALARSPRAAAAAAPKPAIAATFSVPARSRFSWPPPVRSGAKVEVLVRPDDRARPLRAADLVGRQGQDVDAERRRCRPECARPPGWRRCGRSRRPHARAAAISATGWMTPVSLLASITETSGRASRAASSSSIAASASSSTTPSPSTGIVPDPLAAETGRRRAPTHARSRRPEGVRPVRLAVEGPVAASAPCCWPRCRRW